MRLGLLSDRSVHLLCAFKGLGGGGWGGEGERGLFFLKENPRGTRRRCVGSNS